MSKTMAKTASANIVTSLWVLIPVKNLVNAKQRLSGILSPSERRALSQAMVEDMLELLDTVPGIDGVLLVSDDSTAELLAYRYGARLIAEKGHSQGLNAAVSQAAAYLPALGASHMLVLHGDLPLICADDIKALIAGLPTLGQAMVRLVPDASRQGSNALLCSLPAPIEFAYGHNSFALHCEACRRQGVAAEQVCLDSLQLDIDTPQDLQALLELLQLRCSVPGKTASVLTEYGVAARLRQMQLSDSNVTSDAAGRAGTGADGGQ